MGEVAEGFEFPDESDNDSKRPGDKGLFAEDQRQQHMTSDTRNGHTRKSTSRLSTSQQNVSNHNVNNHQAKGSFVWEYKVTVRKYMDQTATKDREILRSQLNAALVHFLSLQRAIYLDKFGLLIPFESRENTSHQINNKHLVRKERVVRPIFEKASELIQLHKSEYPQIVELQELAQYIYPRLDIEQQVAWSEKKLRWLLRGLILSIRTEVVVDGFSSQLYSIGDLFALHNRQGLDSKDWFAGSNILLHPRLTIPLEAEVQNLYQQPILESPWELLEAGYGAPTLTFEIDLAEQLRELGFGDTPEFSGELVTSSPLSVAVFSVTQKNGKTGLLYCTNGLRGYRGEEGLGTELLVETSSSHLSESTEGAVAHQLPKRLFTLAWILLGTRADKSLRPGLGLSAEQPLTNSSRSQLTGIFITPCRKIPLSQRCQEGRFQYLNVVGVTDDELKFSELRSSDHLLSLLQCKSFDQVNHPERKSVFSKGSISANSHYEGLGAQPA